MKKKIIIVFILLFVINWVFSIGVSNSSAVYCGTIKETSLDETYNRILKVCDVLSLRHFQLTGKLTKQQTKLLWDALNQYDYQPGELYGVSLAIVDSSIINSYMLAVLIEPDGSLTWKGVQCF